MGTTYLDKQGYLGQMHTCGGFYVDTSDSCGLIQSQLPDSQHAVVIVLGVHKLRPFLPRKGLPY